MMKRVASVFVGSLAVAMVGSAVQAQQVTIGPMAPSGTPGQQVGFNITYTGPTNTNGISFNIMYPPSVAAAFTPVFRTGSTTRIQCATAADLDPGITTSGVVLASGKIAFTVIGLSLDTGPIAFGRTGVVGTCQFTIAQGAPASVPLTCDTTAGQTTASDVTGANLSATCVDGSLTVTGGGPTATPTTGAATATPTTGVATATPTTGVATATPTRPVATATPTTGVATATPTRPVATATPTTRVATATPTGAPATATATKGVATATPTTAPTTGPGTPTPVPTQESDDDGCQISTVGGGSGWLLLIPAATLLVLRRKRR